MPIRNMWSLQPGEALTAEAILKNVPGCHIYFPLHDSGVDLLVAKGEKLCGVQVKESRYYWEKKWDGSWHQIRRTSLTPPPSSKKVVPDFVVFLTYWFDSRALRRSFEERYLIIPIVDLRSRATSKRPDKNGVYSFCFCFDGHMVYDVREEWLADAKKIPTMDYTSFLDKWVSIQAAL